MHAWPGSGGDIMGPTVARTASSKINTPPLKNGSDLRESGYLIAVGSRTARFRRRHMNKMLLLLLATLIALLFIALLVFIILYVKEKFHKPIRLCKSKECLRSAANLALSMDKNANPCDDFYQFVCGNWAQDHPRPDAYRSYDWFRDKQSKVYALVRDFLAKNISDQPLPVQQAKDLYTACMDTEKLDKLRLKPVLKILDTLDLPHYPTYINLTEDFDYSTYNFNWLDTVIKIKTQLGMDVLIGFDIFTDPKNSSIYRLVMGSPETTNPFPSMHNDKKKHIGYKNKRPFKILTDDVVLDETFVLNNEQVDNGEEKKKGDDEKTEHIYKLFYAELMKLFVIETGEIKDSKIGEVELDQNIILTANEYFMIYNDVYELETNNDTEIDSDDFLHIPEYTVDEIQTHTDMIVENNNGTAQPIWKEYLEGVFCISNVTLNFETDKILISESDMKYLGLIAAYLSNTPPVVIELYIWVKVVEVMAAHTTKELRLLYQRSYDDMRTHRPESPSPPRSLQCASAVNDLMGMAISYAIVDPHFHNFTRPKIQIMLDEIKNALAHLVGKTKWMDDDTKLATYQKIIQMKTLIGFPDWFYEEGRLEEFYEGIEVNTDTHLDNMINIIQVKIKKVLNKFRNGNNYTWATDPTEVNAYHTFQENTITVPMVMLQYPFFNLGLDSLNYGSLGTVLGHEVTHGFDNFGRQFDKNGNLLPWWTNDTIDSFVNMTQCFIDQYSAYYLPELDEYLDGKKTLGENIADNGGVREALLALKRHLHMYGPEEKLPGFEHMTSEQLFFLSYGNLWCGVSTRDSLEADLNDEHSPQKFRARGALQNNEEFAKAWHCPPGSPMNPTKRCIIF
ncbi:endothelin-converting enzyme 2-like [Galleria mellonella]|uniref:Endothelin-converting enzyme 2-like n=1 Tax=Galleria mellonella TaxID=7137 RepID=A0A6J3C3I2_GALME|nr:endothelin-converting enzyme 2-like [Galleria mellonella]